MFTRPDGKSLKILDVGCGPVRKIEGSVGLDIVQTANVDVVHDLNIYPYPFADNAFDFIEMSHVIEHVDRAADLMKEIHRISRPGATVHVLTPHYSSQLSYGDLEHYHHFGFITFLCLSNTRFKLEAHKLHFSDFYKIFGLSLLANFFPRRWEKYLAFMIPAMYVEVNLKVIKVLPA